MGIIIAVCVGDEHGLLFRLDGLFAHLVHQGTEGSRSAPSLGDGSQLGLRYPYS